MIQTASDVANETRMLPANLVAWQWASRYVAKRQPALPGVAARRWEDALAGKVRQ